MGGSGTSLSPQLCEGSAECRAVADWPSGIQEREPSPKLTNAFDSADDLVASIVEITATPDL